MWKSKIGVQIVVCLVIMAAYGTIQLFDMPLLQDKCSSAVAAMSKHYTVRDIADGGKNAVASLIKMPAAVSSYINTSREKREYGLPLDELAEGETGAVYAVAGGRVYATGTDENIGNYIIVEHEDTFSIYGNCDETFASEAEHVRKGQVIASFTNDGTAEFYYQLKEKE